MHRVQVLSRRIPMSGRGPTATIRRCAKKPHQLLDDIQSTSSSHPRVSDSAKIDSGLQFSIAPSWRGSAAAPHPERNWRRAGCGVGKLRRLDGDETGSASQFRAADAHGPHKTSAAASQHIRHYKGVLQAASSARKAVLLSCPRDSVDV